MSAPESVAEYGAHRRTRAPASLMIIILSSLVGIAVGLALGVRGGNLATLALTMIIAVLALLPMLVILGRPTDQKNMLLSLFCLGFIARFVIPPLILYVPSQAPVDAPSMYLSMLRPWDVANGQFVVLIGLISFLLGHTIPVLRLLGPGFPVPRRHWSPGATIGVGTGLVLFGWLITAAATFNLIPAALGSGVISTLSSSLIFGNVLLALAAFRYRSRSALVILFITLPTIAFAGFLSGSKTSTLIAPAFVALTYIFERRRIPLSFVAIGVLLLAVVYPASNFVRDALLGPGLRGAAQVLLNPGDSASEVGRYVGSMGVGEYLGQGFSAVAARLDSTGVVSVIVRDTPRLSPYQNGSTLVLFFVSFIPRALWPGKPNIAIGQFITDVYGSGPEIESSTGPSQIGDYYLNFGHAGVIMGMLILGVFFRFSHDLLLSRRPTAPALLVVVGIVLCLVITFETNVALTQARIVFFVVPIVLAHFLVLAVDRGSGSRESGNP